MMANSSAQKSSATPQSHLLAAYGLFILSAVAVWHLVADGEFSAILTLSVMLQTLAVTLLAVQVLLAGSMSGISAKTLMLDALALCCRLSSTLWLNGYLPVDASGDYMYQAFDILSVGILVWLLHELFVVRRHTYQAEQDSLTISPLVLGAFVLAAILHGNMNDRPFFDTMWMASLFLGTISVLPQLWLITRTGGRVEALMSHHIAAMAASSILSGIFMWHARADVTCQPWVQGVNHAIWAILAAHVFHLMLLGDFGYCYVKAVAKQGLACQIDVRAEMDLV